MQDRDLTLFLVHWWRALQSILSLPLFFMVCWLDYLLITCNSSKPTTQHTNSKHFEEKFYRPYEVTNEVSVPAIRTCGPEDWGGGGRLRGLTCIHVSTVSRSVFPTVCDPVGCSPPGSSVHEILQARTLEGVAIPYSGGSSWPRD